MQVITGWKSVVSLKNNIVAQGHQSIAIFNSDLDCLKVFITKSPISFISVDEQNIAYICTKHYGVIDKDNEQQEFEFDGGQCIIHTKGVFVIAAGLNLFRIENQVVIRTLKLNELACDMAYESNTKTLAVGTSRKNVHLFDLELNPIYKIQDNESFVRSVAWQYFNDAWHLATASNDYTVRVYKYTPEDTVKLWLETVLFEHSDWVLDVVKHPNNNGGWFSSSADQSIIYWKYEDKEWESEMFGTLGMGQIQSVTAISTPQLSVYGITHNGALVKWNADDTGFTIQPGQSGHIAPVMDLQWHSSGCLFSCGQDRTTRLYAPYKMNQQFQFREFARPQVHGYTMQTLSVGDCLITSGEEKVARVFGVSSIFKKRLEKSEFVKAEKFNTILDQGMLGASLPALGLTNKAIYNASDAIKDEKVHAKDRFASYGTDVVFSATLNSTDLPIESQLLQHTLWPELQKLYGHGDNVFAIASFNFDGEIMIATSCKATTVEQAVIRIYSFSKGLTDQQYSWEQVQVLKGHKLTITRMKFSTNGSYLLSVGRDRTIHIFNTSDWSNKTISKAHTRIIWDTCWIDNKSFVTCSRDKTVKHWELNQGEIKLIKSTSYDQSCTAIDYLNGKLAIGMEDGTINENGNIVGKHAGTVNRIAYHPFKSLLASCSADHSILILGSLE